MQRSQALGLTVCDADILDQYTGKRTIVGAFDALVGETFPFTASPLTVHAVLTDGQGRMTLDLRITDMDEEVEPGEARMAVEFPTQLDIGHVRFHFPKLTFPKPGVYVFELFADDEPVCHRRVNISARGVGS